MDLDDIVRRIQLELPMPSSKMQSTPTAADPAPELREGVYSDPDFKPAMPAEDQVEVYSDADVRRPVRE
jgi:hypothetical protein